MSTNFIAEVLRLKHENAKTLAALKTLQRSNESLRQFAREMVNINVNLTVENDFLRRPVEINHDPYWLQRMLPKEEK